MPKEALDWSLLGEHGQKSLLKDSPIQYLKPAVDIVEALHHENVKTGSGANIEDVLITDLFYDTVDRAYPKRAIFDRRNKVALFCFR